MILKASPVKLLLILALLFTLLNSIKPLCIDDTILYYRARQVATHPLDPYGFTIFWYDRPQPAIQVLAPPLFPYYWGAAIKLFGERTLLWKLWLLPLSLLLIFSLHALFRRFACGYEMLLTWMTALSPTFLPGFNLMLEVPVFALSLCALNQFFRALERNSMIGAALSGIVAGFAMQTKYTAFVLPVVMLLYAILFKKSRFGMLAASLGIAVFWSLEGLFAVSAGGHSHLLYQSSVFGAVNFLKKYVYLAMPLMTTIGAVAPALALLNLIALRASKRVVCAAAIFIALGYFLIAFVPDRFAVFAREAKTNEPHFTIAYAFFSVFGVGVGATLVQVIKRLCRSSGDEPSLLMRWRDYRIELFLVGWLCVELVAYFVLSPFPAARRVCGVVIVMTLLAGRLLSTYASQTPELRREKRALARIVAAGSIALGLLFYGVDLHDAFVEKIAAERAAKRAFELNATNTRDANVWYVGRWGFQFYAERAGMKPVLPDESQLHISDLLVTTDSSYTSSPLEAHLAKYDLELIERFDLRDALSLSTMLGYYNSGIPIHHSEERKRSVKIYRVARKKSSP